MDTPPIADPQGGDAYLPLLATKLHVPQMREGRVPRERLLQRLDQGVRGRLTTIAAPAGYGKTTLLATWAARHPFPVAWLSLDEEENDPGRFWSYVIAAFEAHFPVGVQAREWLAAPQPPPLETIVTALLNDLTGIGEEMVLVLDDYHLIEEPAIHRALTYWLEHQPPSLHLFVASRADPPLPLSRWRVRGQLVEVRAGDLRFTVEEAATFLNEGMGLTLTAAEVAALEARTEGWIAGLQLAALSLQGRDDVGRFLEAFTGNHRYVVDYLGEEILQQQPPESQTFLLDTSILERLTASLCDAVTGSSGSQAMLEMLENRNLLLLPLDDDRRWYRYHQLFSTFLRTRLRQQAPERIPLLHLRASEWYESAGSLSDAIHHGVAAESWDRVARLIVEAEHLLRGGEVNKVQRWLDALPDAYEAASPRLSLLRAWGLLRSGDHPTLRAQVERVERMVGDAPELPPEEARLIQGQVAALRAYLATVDGDLQAVIRLSRQALAALPEGDRLLRGLIALNLTNVHHLAGDEEAARQAEEEAHAISQATDDVQALHVRAGLQMLQGHLHQAAQSFRQILQRARFEPFLRSAACIGLGEILYQWNDLAGAARYLQEGIAQSQESEAVGEMAALHIGLARVYQAQGKGEAAREEMEAGLRYVERQGGARLLPQLSTAAARFALSRGELARARRWARAADLPLEPLLPSREMEYLTLVRLQLAEGETAAALRLLDQLERRLPSGERPQSAIERLLLRALAQQQAGRPAPALDSLTQAVALAEPEEVRRPFLDEGEPLRTLLGRLLRERPDASPEYAAELYTALGDPPDAATLPRSEAAQTLIEPLTERELEVLACVTQGMTNAEIADSLVVAVSTVRTHLKNIYGKLAVRNRVEAVTRGQDLGLVER